MISSCVNKETIDSLELVVNAVSNNIAQKYNSNSYRVRENDSCGYDVVTNDGEVVYSNIIFFSVACIIAHAWKMNDRNLCKKLELEEQLLTKYYNDMLFYKNSENWELYETAKICAIEHLWVIKNIISKKIYYIDK